MFAGSLWLVWLWLILDLCDYGAFPWVCLFGFFFPSKEENDSCAMTLLLTGEWQGFTKTVLNFNAPN